MCLFVYLCAYVSICVWLSICIFVFIPLFMYTSTYVFMYVFAYLAISFSEGTAMGPAFVKYVKDSYTILMYSGNLFGNYPDSARASKGDTTKPLPPSPSHQPRLWKGLEIVSLARPVRLGAGRACCRSMAGLWSARHLLARQPSRATERMVSALRWTPTVFRPWGTPPVFPENSARFPENSARFLPRKPNIGQEGVAKSVRHILKAEHITRNSQK